MVGIKLRAHHVTALVTGEDDCYRRSGLATFGIHLPYGSWVASTPQVFTLREHAGNASVYEVHLS